MYKNKYDVLSKVFDVLIDIGLDLERIRAYSALYPTPRMLEFTADLYAAIVEFLEQVIKDEKKGAMSMQPGPWSVEPLLTTAQSARWRLFSHSTLDTATF